MCVCLPFFAVFGLVLAHRLHSIPLKYIHVNAFQCVVCLMQDFMSESHMLH